METSFIHMAIESSYPGQRWPDTDVDDPLIMSRVLRLGSLDAVRRLVPLDTLRREFGNLDLPLHVRGFRESVLKKLAELRPA